MAVDINWTTAKRAWAIDSTWTLCAIKPPSGGNAAKRHVMGQVSKFRYKKSLLHATPQTAALIAVVKGNDYALNMHMFSKDVLSSLKRPHDAVVSCYESVKADKSVNQSQIRSIASKCSLSPSCLLCVCVCVCFFYCTACMSSNSYPSFVCYAYTHAVME